MQTRVGSLGTRGASTFRGNGPLEHTAPRESAQSLRLCGFLPLHPRGVDAAYEGLISGDASDGENKAFDDLYARDPIL